MLKTTLESIEATRMALCALSYEGEDRARAVHTLRLTHFARLACPHAEPRTDLDEMVSLCEVASLDAGYWLPAPPSTVDLGAWTLLLAPHPRKELERGLGLRVDALGLARVHKGRVNVGWPRRTVRQWTRIPADTATWAEAELDRHRIELLATSSDGVRVEFYRAAPRRRDQVPRRWLHLQPGAELPPPGALVLFREINAGRVARHFIGMQKNGRLTHEAPLRCDLLRLQYGLEMLAGGSQLLVAEARGSDLHVRLRRALPPEERVVFVALATLEPGEDFTDIRIPVEVADICFGCLEGLGFRIERRQ